MIFDEVVAATRERAVATDDLPKQVVVTTHSAEVLASPRRRGAASASSSGAAPRVRCSPWRAPSSRSCHTPESVGRLRIDALWPSQEPLRHEGDLMEP